MDTLKNLGFDPSLLEADDIKQLEKALTDCKLPLNTRDPKSLFHELKKKGVDFGKMMRKMRKNVKPKTSVRIGRNEPCICESGKKYKKCCGSMV